MDTPMPDTAGNQQQRKFFISYAHREPDEEKLAAWLCQELTQAGHVVFLDTRMSLGDNWDEEIPRCIAECEFFIVLLSAASINSEMVIEEVRLARDARLAQGKPHYLPIRVKYSGPLGYALGAYLNRYQWRTWQTEADSVTILREVLGIAGGTIPAPAEQPSISGDAAQNQAAPDLNIPQPMAELRNLPAPGGALRPDDRFYIERAADAEILAASQRTEETTVIQGARQTGKSSLLKRYLMGCHQAGKKTVLVDLSLFANTELVEYNIFLTAIAADMLDKLELDLPAPAIRTQAEMTRFLQRTLLKALTDPLVLAFDEVDRIIGRAYQSDFFSMLRYWHERRTDIPPTDWVRTEMILVISTEAYLLVTEADRSPFNIRAPIELHSFNQAECRRLNGLYNNLLDDSQLERLWELLQGHPYLLRRAYYLLTGPQQLAFDALCQAAHREDGPFGDHLRSLTIQLRKFGGKDLGAALLQIINHGTAPDDDAFQRLHSAGLVRKQADRIVPANQLYARYFGGQR